MPGKHAKNPKYANTDARHFLRPIAKKHFRTQPDFNFMFTDNIFTATHLTSKRTDKNRLKPLPLLFQITNKHSKKNNTPDNLCSIPHDHLK